jgi:GNAT superfamily N-acetyltransferase
VEIVRASDESISFINGLIERSKSYWNYPKDYLRAALPLLFVDSTYLSNSFSFEIRNKGVIVGFFAISDKNGEKYLDHLWIEPSLIRKGLGRKAVNFIDILAKERLWKSMITLPDPGASEFYRKLGFEDTGITKPSRVANGPSFCIYKKLYVISDL